MFVGLAWVCLMRWRLVDSSAPGAVERDRAIWLLVERAVLARGSCAPSSSGAANPVRSRRPLRHRRRAIWRNAS